jgi:Alpha-tubulin suppressor and related RCC1 domain-containing proteins
VAGSAALLNDGKVVPWSTGYTNIAVPPNVSNVVALESGLGSQYLALRNDGTLISWGNPTLPLFFDRFIAIACGTFHNLAVRTDGIVYSWGYSLSYGNNVPAGLSGVIAVAAGYNHSLALKSDGTVIAWGGNISVPTNGPAGLSNIIAIACGEYHALALHNDGRVSAWGGLGRGETNVPPDLTNAIAISALSGHSLALRDDGTVVAWGYNFDGQCNVPHGLTNVVKIRAGGKTSLALTGVKNPLITAEPRGLTTPTGTTARLGVWSAGYLPESYQWSHGGADIPGATGPSLSVTNVHSRTRDVMRSVSAIPTAL